MVLESVISQQLVPTADKRGRVAAFEVMHGTVAIKNLIREGKTAQIQSHIQTSKGIGMKTMDDALYELYINGKIDSEQAIIFAQDQLALEKKIRG
jgi:twitching motility protein PilT